MWVALVGAVITKSFEVVVNAPPRGGGLIGSSPSDRSAEAMALEMDSRSKPRAEAAAMAASPSGGGAVSPSGPRAAAAAAGGKYEGRGGAMLQGA